jgi:NAD(P)-dependent dehydrogenase (short-subunit alcohol dehydrogenase family)
VNLALPLANVVRDHLVQAMAQGYRDEDIAVLARVITNTLTHLDLLEALMPKANEHVVVIGGTSGIGLPLARAARALGCTLTIAGRGVERASEIAKSMGPGVTGCHLDLEDVASIRTGMTDGPTVDHLVLVPIYSLATSVKDFNVDEANRHLHIKLTGYIETVRTVLPRLKPTSTIVLFGGLAKERPYPTSTMITVANAGIIGAMKTLAVELASIRVNSVSSGLVGDSPKWDAIVKEGENHVVKAMAARTPTHRFTTTNDVIHAVFFLLDNLAVNGLDVTLDGGIQLV